MIDYRFFIVDKKWELDEIVWLEKRRLDFAGGIPTEQSGHNRNIFPLGLKSYGWDTSRTKPAWGLKKHLSEMEYWKKY